MMARGPAVAAPSAQAEAPDPTTDSDLLRALRGLPNESRTAVYLADIEGYQLLAVEWAVACLSVQK
jgi:DNA-directed RNA polymerase specialized sigma24 family protein